MKENRPQSPRPQAVRAAAPRQPAAIATPKATPPPKGRPLLKIVSTLFVLGTVLYVGLLLIPLETRENSLSRFLPKALLFRETKLDHSVTLEEGVPLTFGFSSKTRFRLSGLFRVKSPVLDQIHVGVRATAQTGAGNAGNTLQLTEGQSEVQAFNDVLPAGTYNVRVELQTKIKTQKLPAELLLTVVH